MVLGGVDVGLVACDGSDPWVAAVLRAATRDMRTGDLRAWLVRLATTFELMLLGLSLLLTSMGLHPWIRRDGRNQIAHHLLGISLRLLGLSRHLAD